MEYVQDWTLFFHKCYIRDILQFAQRTPEILKYRQPSLSAGLLFAVSTIRGHGIVYKICYPRTFPLIIRGFCPFSMGKGYKKV